MEAATEKADGPTGRRIRRYGSVYTAALFGVGVTLLAYATRGLAIELGGSAFFLSYLVMVAWRLRRA